MEAKTPRDLLVEELSALRVDDEEDVLEWIPLASRLAGLGEPHLLADLPRLLEMTGADLSQLIERRAREGAWDLEQSLDEQLGHAIIEAQDFACFRRAMEDELEPRAKACLDVWIQRAEDTPLDAEAVDLIGEFRDRFPIQEAWQILPVASPTSEFELDLLAEGARALPVIECAWSEKHLPAASLVACADGERPPEKMRQLFERREFRFEVEGRGFVTITRQLDEHWRMIFHIESPETLRVRSLRVKLMPGKTSDGTTWIVDLEPFSSSLRREALDQATVLTFEQGFCLRIL